MPVQETFSIFDTSWGSCGIVARHASLVAVYLPMNRQGLRRRIRDDWPGAEEVPDVLPVFRQEVLDYFEGREPRFTAKIDLSGVPRFRRKVLEACRKVPYGSTVSYGELARAAGNPRAARAVGSAMAQNPLPLLIPCHRVLRSDGSIGGFSAPGCVQQKKRMLKLEGVL